MMTSNSPLLPPPPQGWDYQSVSVVLALNPGLTHAEGTYHLNHTPLSQNKTFQMILVPALGSSRSSLVQVPAP